MIRYEFITIKEFINYMMAHPGKELGFTGDTEDDIEVYGGPEGWYGAKIDNSFDGNTLLFGEYGIGIGWTYEIECDDDCIEFFHEFFGDEFLREVDEDSLICIDTEDFEGR